MRIWSKSHAKTASCIIIICLLPLSTSHAQCIGDCGDANGNGTITSADWQAIMEWMWFGVTPAGSEACADIDGYQGVTISDAHLMMRCIFVCDPPEAFFDCDTPQAAIVPLPTDLISIYYPNAFPAGDSVVTISLRLHTLQQLGAMTLPLSVTVGGIVPLVQVLATDQNDVWDIDTSNTSLPNVAAGQVLLGFENLNFSQYLNDPLAVLQINVPPSGSERTVVMEYVSLPPSNIAAAIADDFESGTAYEPHLYPCNIETFGDVNATGTVTTADILMVVLQLWKANGPVLIPCMAAGDVNCSGSVTSSDVIYLVNYLFKGGPAPCNICAMLGSGIWDCP